MWKKLKRLQENIRKFINEEFGVEKDLTDKQKSLLRCAEKIPSKRKATKDPLEPRPKKVSRKAYGQKKSRKPRKLILNETDEDREKAETEATLAKVAKLEAKEKEKEAALANSWESGVEPNKDAHIDSVLSPKAAAEILANQKIYKTLDNGKYPDYIVNGLVNASVFEKSTSIQPPLVPVKHIFENLLADIDPPKDCMKRRSYSQCKSLREECSKSEPFVSKPKPSKPFQIKPPESQTNQLSDIAVTGDAPSDHLVQNDEDSEETPPQKNTPPHPSTSMVDQDTQTKVAIPEVDQTKPTSPPPSETDHTILSENQTQLQPEPTIQPPPEILPEP
jgi:hypothetical protein